MNDVDVILYQGVLLVSKICVCTQLPTYVDSALCQDIHQTIVVVSSLRITPIAIHTSIELRST